MVIFEKDGNTFDMGCVWNSGEEGNKIIRRVIYVGPKGILIEKLYISTDIHLN